MTPGRILVTGANGLIGSHLVDTLAPDHDVSAIVRAPTGRDVDGVNWLVRNLAVPGFTDGLPDDVGTVVHLAQSDRFRDFPAGADDVFRVNVASTAELLHWAQATGARRVIIASSGGIYGHGTKGFREEDQFSGSRQLGFYLASKHAAEVLAEAYGSLLTVIVLRFFFVYGPGQNPSMFIPRLVASVQDGRAIVLQGEVGFSSNPVHVSDAVRAVVTSLGLVESQLINVAGPEVLDLRRIGRIIGDLVGREPVFETEPESRPRDLIGDTARMSKVLGPPEIRLGQGLVPLCSRG